jgi:GMP synthase-like glutamine amidotransferase
MKTKPFPQTRGPFPDQSFHWHSETFTLPPGAVHIARSAYCENQMFALGKHLGMQCHIEITPELVASWCADWHNEVQTPAQSLPSVQTPAQMLDNAAAKTAERHPVADGIYQRWLPGLAR